VANCGSVAWQIFPAISTRRIDTIGLMTGQPKSLQLGTLLTHLYHHQTHRRGQITPLLSRLGVDSGETGMIWMPDVN